MRSPALESLERGKRARAGRQLHRPAKRPASSGRKMRYAAEEALARPAIPRKKLPRHAAPIKNQGRTGLTVGWRLQALWEPARQTTPVQVISEEEQEKLAALELDMRLPRVAGKFDSWLLIIVLALLCIGLVMVYSASSFVAAHAYGDASYFFQRQFLWVVMGIIVMLVTMHVDYRQWRRFSLIGRIVILALLVICLND